MFRLSDTETNQLLEEAETGMGYQLVEVTRRDNTMQRGFAYNAELVLVDTEPRRLMLADSYARLLEEAPGTVGEIKSIRVVGEGASILVADQVHDSDNPYGALHGPASGAPFGTTRQGETFTRFSAYRNDRRITPAGRLRAGTYATTEQDAEHVKTGAEAVARYALANPQPASHVFTIHPSEGTVMQRGLVHPAHGQPGGGVEVIFTNGTQPKSVTGPERIPDQ